MLCRLGCLPRYLGSSRAGLLLSLDLDEFADANQTFCREWPAGLFVLWANENPIDDPRDDRHEIRYLALSWPFGSICDACRVTTFGSSAMVEDLVLMGVRIQPMD